MVYRARPIPSIIQGVSQQTAQSRRDAQCDAQQDCFNSPRLGVVARNGADMRAFISGLNLVDPFVYELIRGSIEHYLMVLSDGTLRIYDLNTFSLCSVTPLGGSTYLNSVGGVADRDNFRVQSVGDHTFITNLSIAPLMNPAITQPKGNPAAIVFFQAGNYLVTYRVSVEYAGTLYTFDFQTPDNSVAANAQYIQTNQIAATFFRAMTGNLATTGGTGVGVGSAGLPGVTGIGGGGADYTVTAPTTLTSLGFTVTIEGNLLLIQRTADTNPFTVDATDGSGDNAVTVIQDQVQSFSDLPKGGFEGFTVQVMGVGGLGSNSSYYVTFNLQTAAGGSWLESPAPGVTTTFENSTMPLAIFCSAVDTFEVVQPPWTIRLSGDGVTNTFNPGFVGLTIQDLGYINGRLVIVTESTYDMTQPNNVYNWWPDSAQVVLDTDPISGQVAASETTALLRRAAVIDESLTLWAQWAQFRVNSGVNPFTAANILAPQTTSYEFNANSNFGKIGTSLYFSYEADLFATVYNLQYQQGRATGETEITAHVQEYIPAGVRGLSTSTPLGLIFIRTDGAANSLFLYNFLVQGDTVEQSAWNQWNLPAGTILWHTVFQQFLFVMLQRPEGVVFLTVPLNPAHFDAGGQYQTRLDLRLTEATVSSATFNAAANTTTINFPYTLTVAEQASVKVVIRTSDVSHLRGKVCNNVGTTANSVTVTGNVTASEFYLGLSIVSQRVESPFYIRTSTGHIPTEALTIRVFELDYRDSGYTRITVANTNNGSMASLDAFDDVTQELGVITLDTGSMRQVVDGDALDVVITCINDSPFPSQWTSSTYEFESVERATPMLTPYGGPVQ